MLRDGLAHGHAHGIEGELAQGRLGGRLDQRVVGGLALDAQDRVARDVAGAALGDLALERHVDVLGPGAREQARDGIHDVGQLAAVDGREGVGLAPNGRGVDAAEGAQDDVDEVVAHGVEREAAARDGQAGAAAGPRKIGAVAALAAGFVGHGFLSL